MDEVGGLISPTLGNCLIEDPIDVLSHRPACSTIASTLAETADTFATRLREENSQAVSLYEVTRTGGPQVINPAGRFLLEENLAALQRAEESLIRAFIPHRRLHNRLSYLLRLPDEIIVRIVLTYIHGVLRFPGNDGINPVNWYDRPFVDLKQRLAVTQLCSQWREICHHARIIWSDIDMMWPSTAIEAFATRAGKMSLSLNFQFNDLNGSFPNGYHDAVLEVGEKFVANNMYRVRQLVIGLCLLDHEVDFPAFWNHFKYLSAPKLQKLEISGTSSLDEDALLNLFSHEAPALKSIHLRGCPIRNFDLAPFQALTSLNIDLSPSAPELHLSQLPLLLSRSPGVVELTLFGDVAFSDVNLMILQPIFTLRECTSLTLIGFFADHINFILSSISFPALQDLALKSRSRLSVEETPTTCLHPSLPFAIKDSCRRAEGVSFWLEEGRINLEIEYSAGSGEDHLFKLEESFRGLPQAKMKPAVIQLLTKPRLILDIEPAFLYVSSSDELPEDLYLKGVWTAFLSAYPSVERISIDGTVPVGPFVAVLNNPNILCPSLNNITIETEDPLQDGTRRAITRMLRNRRRRGVSIETVQISEIDPDSDME
ncbi:hypothetical protein SISSUDRAFT_1047581 [Sistotremastrum suecicum HHB10207 ss-3]|uniref:Uncharacterized protein n=1 Tax=Sistotremastrum suecicum HHB10207 ss-3 TaxID=1314776 RepID=A0A166D3K6_9AGAM|nr:hypothetical protein SISSUDRAFT_1047581 [Sistotremastrum suecicum HHB10207 ss-3]